MPLFHRLRSTLIGCSITTTGRNLMGASISVPVYYRNPWTSEQLYTVPIRVNSGSGSPQLSDLQVAVFDDDNGYPGTNQLTPWLSPLGSGPLNYPMTYSIDFSSQNLWFSAGTGYWITVRNANSNPASNWFSILLASVDSADHGFRLGGTMFVRLGNIVYQSALQLITSAGVYGITPVGFVSDVPYAAPLRYGVRFTTPGWCRVSVSGFAMYVRSSTGGQYQFILYRDSTQIASGNAIVMSSSAMCYATLSSPVQLMPSTTYRLVSVPGSATHYLGVWYVENIGDPWSRIPLRACVTYSGDGGATWTDIPTAFSNFFLLVDPDTSSFGAEYEPQLMNVPFT